MSSKPDISIIMPVYNAEEFVGDSITSVLIQSFQNFELIVINDGSTDGSETIIKSFKDERIVYYSQTNQGQVVASNQGIKLARGKYIKFLDADDLINSAHLECQFEALKGNDTCLASCQWAYFYKNFRSADFKEEYTNKNYNNPLNWFYDSHVYDSGMLGAWVWLIPRQLLDKAGNWNEKLSLNNDFDFSVRLLCACNGIKYAEGAKLYYRKGNLNALTLTKNRKGYESAILTTELAMDSVLKIENSPRMKELFANRFQSWIYEIYPQHPDLIRKANSYIKTLGGSNLNPSGGRLFKCLNTVLHWKLVMQLQFILHKTIWKPILIWKNNKKLKKQMTPTSHFI